MGSTEEHQKLVDELLLAFGSQPDIRAFPRNVGLAYRDGAAIRYGVRGESDISGFVAPRGRAWFCECKSGWAQLSEVQVRFRDMVLRFGCIYILARSHGFDDIPRAVEAATQSFRLQLR